MTSPEITDAAVEARRIVSNILSDFDKAKIGYDAVEEIVSALTAALAAGRAEDVAAGWREKLAAMMLRQSLATGHGDDFDDLLRELEWQIAERAKQYDGLLTTWAESRERHLAAEAKVMRLRGTLEYIAAQAKQGYPTVLSVIHANATAAMDDEWQKTVASALESVRWPEVADKLFWSAKEFIDDWKKGDFSLSTLAALDAQSLDDALVRYSEARRSALVSAPAAEAEPGSSFWGAPEHERGRMLSRIRELETALPAPSASQEALREALAMPSWTGWRSIDTAPEDQHVILATAGGFVGEAIMLIDEDTGGQKWAWALGPVHPNHQPYGWMPLPDPLRAPVASDLRPDGFDGPTGAE